MNNYLKVRPLFVVALLLTLVAYVWAADQANELDYHTAPSSAVAIGDASSGNCVEISDCGAMLVEQNFAISKVVANTDQWITCNRSFVYAVILSGDGVTVGDHIELKDGNGTCGIPRIRLECTATDGNEIFTSPVPIEFSDRIYLDVTRTGGEMSVTIVYKAPNG